MKSERMERGNEGKKTQGLTNAKDLSLILSTISNHTYIYIPYSMLGVTYLLKNINSKLFIIEVSINYSITTTSSSTLVDLKIKVYTLSTNIPTAAYMRTVYVTHVI